MTDPKIHRVFRIGAHWCVVADNGLAFYVGYVSVPEDHPWYGLHYDTIMELYDTDVHGGLTFSDEREWSRWQGDGAPAGWYVGFDLGHYCDMPIEGSHIAKHWVWSSDVGGLSHVWDDDLVAAEVRNLALQAQAAGTLSQTLS